jgi:hypothetical protein
MLYDSRLISGLLKSLGFTPKQTIHAHVFYWHEGTGTIILLPPFEKGGCMQNILNFTVRRVLDERGLLNADDWDDAIRKVRKRIRTYVGYRVKTSDGWYVQDDGRYVASPKKPQFVSRSRALRLLADWLERGYEGSIVRVYRPLREK